MIDRKPRVRAHSIRLEEDIELAQSICEGLRAENRNAILPLYRQYGPFFLAFVKRRIRNENDALDVLNDFWMKMLTGEILCNYEARANAGLKTYLASILNKGIIDWYRRSKRDEDRKVIPISGDVEDSDIQSGELSGISCEPERGALLKRPEALARRVVNEALVTLSRTHPRDASLIRMHLRSMPHEEKARHLLMAEGDASYSPDNLKRKTNAIKKHWSRPQGTLYRFSQVVRRIMERDDLGLEDFN